MHFIVAVYDQNKLILEDAIELEINKSFDDLLIETLDFVTDRRVTVKFYNTLTKNWTRVKKGLDMDLKICEMFNPCQVRFILENDDMNELETNVNSIDPFKIMKE